MKLLKLVACILIFTLAQQSAICQDRYHYVHPDFNSFGGDLQYIGNDSIRMIGLGSNEIFFGSSGMYQTYLTLSGDIFPSQLLPEIWGESGYTFATMSLYDGAVAVLSNMSGCDFGLPPQLALYDSAGELQWYIEAPDAYSPTPRMTLVEDSVIAIVAGSDTRYYDLTGLVLGAEGRPASYDLQMMLGWGFLVSRQNTFKILNANFEILDAVSFTNPIHAFDTTANKGFVVVTGDSIFALNSDLEILNRGDVTSEFTHVVSSNYGYWLFNSGTQIDHFTSTLEADTSYTLDLPVTIRDVLHVADTIFIAGTHDNGYNTAMFCIRTEAQHFLDKPNPDVELTDITFTDTVVYGKSELGFGSYQIDYGPIHVTIANHSAQRVNSAFLRFNAFYCPGICPGHYQLEWRIDDLDLNPQDTATVFLTDLSLYCAHFSPFEFCLWTAGPNDQPDGNEDNDYLCVQIDRIISGTRNYSPSEQLSIVPNPASTEVTVHAPDSEYSSVSIINTHGQRVAQIAIQSEKTPIALEQFPPGFYYFLVKGPGVTPVIRKVVVLGRT